MFTFGTDFNYQNANTWFKNMDKLIHYVNQDVRDGNYDDASTAHVPQTRFNAFYSTPTLYTQAKFDANITWTTKEDDFFPYAFAISM